MDERPFFTTLPLGMRCPLPTDYENVAMDDHRIPDSLSSHVWVTTPHPFFTYSLVVPDAHFHSPWE